MKPNFRNFANPKSAANNSNAARAQALLNEGLALHQKGRLAQAKVIYERVLKTQPKHSDALHLLGVIAYQTMNNLLAVELINKAIAINPNSAAFYSNRGNALQALQRLDEALESYDQAIKLKEDYSLAYTSRGNTLNDLKRFDEALASHDQAIKLQVDYAEAYSNRGVTLRKLKLLNEALVSFDQAIKFKRDFAEAHYNRGKALHDLRRFDEALTSYDEALKLKADFAEAYNTRGGTLHDLRRFDEAIASYDQALKLKPDLAEAYNNRGLALHDLRRFDEAIASYDQAIKLKMDFADAHWNLSLCLLLRGDFIRGWIGYEWRWKRDAVTSPRRNFTPPLWLGEAPLQGKTILLHSEQGLGDTLQFCRYTQLVAALGGHVILEAPKPLLGLMDKLLGVSQLVGAGDALPAFDYHCPLMSLPLAFKTELHSIPTPKAYLYADKAKICSWQERIGDIHGLKIGVVWNGGFRPNQPEVWGVNERRNIPLKLFAEGLSSLNINFFSLQKGDPAESEIRNCEKDYWPLGNLFNFADELKNFSDTAALIANMDVVVSVDTSTAHLSAALGKPTWILNRYDTCWRWLLGRDDSPWYESVKLYGQGEDRQWAPVLERVARDLLRLSQ